MIIYHSQCYKYPRNILILKFKINIFLTFAPDDRFTKHGNPEVGSACIIHPTGISLIGLIFVFNDNGVLLSLGSYSSSNSANGDEL